MQSLYLQYMFLIIQLKGLSHTMDWAFDDTNLFLHTVKKGLLFSRPQPGCHLSNSPWLGIIE
jgi:hypothetical protein